MVEGVINCAYSSVVEDYKAMKVIVCEISSITSPIPFKKNCAVSSIGSWNVEIKDNVTDFYLKNVTHKQVFGCLLYWTSSGCLMSHVLTKDITFYSCMSIVVIESHKMCVALSFPFCSVRCLKDHKNICSSVRVSSY